MNRLLVIFLCFFSGSLFAQFDKYRIETKESAGFNYETVTNDPLAARIYTLPNGLKVYMTVYKEEPRIQTFIAVRAGSKHDPADATGLAHYLEHMLFKGTSRIGTLNWEEEKQELDKIEALYEEYRKTVSPLKRKNLYKQIDSISLVASRYAIPNEYDKLLSNLGAIGTNAYTFVEQTVYVNNIPSNSLGKWAEIEAERMGNLATRLFHTELEAVYEEKNRGIDNDRRKVWETLLAGTFPDHPYGTQTTIGTVEHLKNPSITEIKKYFQKYYVPNNMAICLSGDFDPDEAIKVIDKHFSALRPLDVEPFIVPEAKPAQTVRVDTVFGPDAENVTIGFRFGGRSQIIVPATKEGKKTIESPDIYMLKLLSMLLNNGQAGLIDLNLNQKQAVLSASAYDLPLNDYSLFVLSGRPKSGQSLEEVKNLLLAQIDSVKNGNFPDWLLEAVLNEFKINRMKEYQSNNARADAFVDAFISGVPWNIQVMEEDILRAFSKEDIKTFVKNRFTSDYQIIYKLTGADSAIQKVEKPAITPVQLNRDVQSRFYESVMMKPVKEIQPVFLDYKKDIGFLKTKNNIEVLYKKNEENDLFNLYYVWDIGKNDNPLYAVATGYMSYLGTKKLSASRLKEEFYKLGCSIAFSATDESVIFSVSGLNDNYEKAYRLFEQVITEAKADQEALKSYVARILKAREDSKKSKDVILRSAMVSYIAYGPENPFTNIAGAEKLNNLKGEALVKLLQGLFAMEHRILYYGPMNESNLIASLDKVHKVPSSLKPASYKQKYVFKEIPQDKIYFVDYDMVQAEVVLLSRSEIYAPSIIPVVTLFNEYFGGSMGSLVFQEMREARALAYSVKSSYMPADRKNEFNYIFSYIGTQADKLNEAVAGMRELLNNMPESELLFNTAQTSVLEHIRTTRITRADVLWNYLKAIKLGEDSDVRKKIFEGVGPMRFSDIEQFQQTFIKNKPMAILIIGSKDKMDLKSMEVYGEVIELNLRQLFGF